MVCSHVRWNAFTSIRGLSKGKRKQKGSNSLVKEAIKIKSETLEVEAGAKGRRLRFINAGEPNKIYNNFSQKRALGVICKSKPK